MGGANTAVLLAGGVGKRLGRDLPKQLVEIGGRPLMSHTLAAFEQHPGIDEIVLMMAPGHLDAARAVVRDGGYAKVRAVLEGADTRSGTTRRALEALGDDGKVLLHDAVRPLVPSHLIGECLRALDRYDAVVAAVPTTDTILEVTEDDLLRGVPRRATLRRAQTPQGFRAAVIKEAYARAAQDPAFEATDDCSVVLRYLPGTPIRVIPGDARNIKVTEPLDVEVAERLLGQ